MEEYNQIVNDWYVKLRSYFINMVHNKYPDLHIEDIEDLYTEAFIAARENMIKGRVASDTNWKAYIFRIGLNMAANKSKQEIKKVQALEQTDDDDIDEEQRTTHRHMLVLIDNHRDDVRSAGVAVVGIDNAEAGSVEYAGEDDGHEGIGDQRLLRHGEDAQPDGHPEDAVEGTDTGLPA